METAISGVISAALGRALNGKTAPAEAAQAPADWRSDWFIFMAADVSDETAAAITKAKAWPAFTAFFRLIWKRQREAEKVGNLEAEAACRAGVLTDAGIRGLARSIGINPKAMNRQVNELVRLGVLSVAKPPAVLERGPDGRIVRRPAHRGLVPAAKVRFTGGDEHRRPANRQGANRPLKAGGAGASQGADRPLKGRRLKGRPDTTSISPMHISPTAGGHADGIGRPAVDAPPPPACPAEATGPRLWVNEDEARRQATMRRLAAEKAARDAEDAAWRNHAAANEAAWRDADVPDATQAAAALQAAVTALPATSRKKAKRVGRGMSKADRQAEAEAKALEAMIERKRQEQIDKPKALAKAFANEAKKAWRGKKAKAKKPFVVVT